MEVSGAVTCTRGGSAVSGKAVFTWGGQLTELVCIPWSLDRTTPKHGLYICTSGIRSASPCAVRRDSPWRGHGPGL